MSYLPTYLPEWWHLRKNRLYAITPLPWWWRMKKMKKKKDDLILKGILLYEIHDKRHEMVDLFLKRRFLWTRMMMKWRENADLGPPCNLVCRAYDVGHESQSQKQNRTTSIYLPSSSSCPSKEAPAADFHVDLPGWWNGRCWWWWTNDDVILDNETLRQQQTAAAAADGMLHKRWIIEDEMFLVCVNAANECCGWMWWWWQLVGVPYRIIINKQQRLSCLELCIVTTRVVLDVAA